nr:hypothetical protein [Bacillota bacterium]
MAMQLLLVAALAFATVVAVFALQNAQMVPIRFFGWERETSVAVISLVAAALGAACALLAGLVRQLGAGLKNRQLRLEVGRLQRELEEERSAKEALVNELEQAKAALAAVQAAMASPAPEGGREEAEEAPGGRAFAPDQA